MEEKKVSLLLLFWKFFKIGLFTFGGGYAMIPLMEREVISNHWIEKEDVTDIVAISQSIPGAVAVNMSLFVGYKIAKKKGAIISVLGCIAPSFIIILLIAMLFSNIQDEVLVQRAFTGVLSAVVAMIIISAINIAKVAIMDKITLLISFFTVGILIIGQYLNLKGAISSYIPIIVIIIGALTGLLLYYVYPKKVREVLKRGGSKK